MSIRLTLSINQEIVNNAKVYAKKKGKSLSQLVEDYFSHLSVKKMTKDKKRKFPLTTSLSGLLKNSNLSKDDNKEYLEKKYL